MEPSNKDHEQKDKKYFHMKFVRYTMLISGIWPMEPGNIKELLYKMYFYITFSYYLLFVTSVAAIAIQTWTDNYLLTVTSMGVVIEYGSNAYKVLIFKSKTFRRLIYQITEKEEQILNSGDKEFIKIYKENASYTRKIVLFYVSVGSIGVSFYFFTPLVSNFLTPLNFNNETGVQEHHFMGYSWFPFDPNRHYCAAYLIQFTGIFYGFTYIVYGGAFYISILTFVTAQLRILQHVFVNFTKYAEKFKSSYGLPKEQSQIILLKKLIEEHVYIINFVQRLNNSIKLFTLMNYIISSFQLSLVAYQISESENIATSIFKGEWHTYSSSLLKMMKMVCLRAQKPLVLTIGPMADVKVAALFQIFKALYSYGCIIMRK